MTLPQIRLKIARKSSHPWIFQKMVDKPAQRLPNGSVVDILERLTEPVYRRVRRFLPPLGPLDLSPMVVIIVLWAIGTEFLPTLTYRILQGSLF